MDTGCRGLEGVERAPAPLEEQRPRLGRLGALAQALEQRQAQGLLELADVQAHGGLAQAERLGRPREALEAGDLVECAQVHRIDGHAYQNFS